MKKLLILLAITGVFTSLPSCKNQGTKEKTKGITEKSAEHKDCSEVHWSYHDPSTSPENWKDLCEDFSPCGGEAQSPIDIQADRATPGENLAAIELYYGKSDVDIVNNGHTVQFNVTGDNTVKLNGKDYKLLQFHYHSLSEHTINGEHFPLEVHFVHKHSDSELAVIGIMFEEGDKYDLFDKYLDHFPTEEGSYKAEDESIDLLSLLPKDKSYYHYNGSLTTPPCSEIVDWYVLSTPLTASKEQIEKFSKILHDNYRPVHPLNGREINTFKE